MEIKITKEIKKNNDIHLTLYVDGKENNTSFIGEELEKGMVNTIINMYGEQVKAILKRGNPERVLPK